MKGLSVIDNMSDWTGKIFSFLVLAATIVVVYGVTMRYVFNAPTTWTPELITYFCAATYMIGGAYAQLADSHVKVDALYLHWSARVRAIVDLCTAPFFFAGLAALGLGGAQWTIKAMVGGTTSGSLWDPIIWPMRMLIPLGVFLLVLQGLATYIRNFHTARTGESHLPEEDPEIALERELAEHG